VCTSSSADSLIVPFYLAAAGRCQHLLHRVIAIPPTEFAVVPATGLCLDDNKNWEHTCVETEPQKQEGEIRRRLHRNRFCTVSDRKRSSGSERLHYCPADSNRFYRLQQSTR
jgi:hypothetical protein